MGPQMSPRSGPRISGKAQNPDPWDLNRGPKGLRDRNSPTCTLSQNGYGTWRCGQKGQTNFPPKPDIFENFPSQI